MGSPDPTDEQVEALLGVKLNGKKEQLLLAITQIDAALGESLRKRGAGGPKLKTILVWERQLGLSNGRCIDNEGKNVGGIPLLKRANESKKLSS